MITEKEINKGIKSIFGVEAIPNIDYKICYQPKSLDSVALNVEYRPGFLERAALRMNVCNNDSLSSKEKERQYKSLCDGFENWNVKKIVIDKDINHLRKIKPSHFNEECVRMGLYEYNSFKYKGQEYHVFWD